jgi:tetratricopeptide (TPR) repeat protein
MCALAAALAAVALEAGGGTRPGPATTVAVALELTGGMLVALACLRTPRTRVWGGLALALMGALAALTALSIAWSVQPADTWLEANRTVSYAFVLASAVALVRLAPQRWAAVLGATLLAAVLISAYALLTKIFPAALAPEEVYARLRDPFGYWNAIGLMAALGVPGCLWLGARRTGHAAVNALAYPAFGLLTTTILLAYSRGAVVAALVGCAFWFVVVPLRLRGVAVLLTGASGGVLVALWAFAQEELSQDRVGLALRIGTGRELGVLVALMLVVLLAAGLATGFSVAGKPPSLRERRFAGVALLCALALVPIAGAGLLAASDRGLGGSISNAWTTLTDPDARVPANDPGRLTAVGSVRARYWDEALKIFRRDELVGAGAGGYATARPRYQRDGFVVRHAHGYVPQTLADLGLAGLLISLALVAALAAAAWRTFGGRRRAWDAERVGLTTMATVVVVFGAHSLIDWTWFIPGNAVVALLCAGWVAGRGPLGAGPEPHDRPGTLRALRDRPRVIAAVAVVVLSLAAAWATLQPLRADHAGQDALDALDRGKVDEARQYARRSAEINPLSIEPLFDLAAIEQRAHRNVAARVALEQAVKLQPANARSWRRLAAFRLDVDHDARAAIDALGPALLLDPRSSEGITLALRAGREG